jgi:hypothetical protein
MSANWTAEELQSGLTQGRGFWATFTYPAGTASFDEERREHLRTVVERLEERWPGIGIGIRINGGPENRLRVQFLPPPGPNTDSDELGSEIQSIWRDLVPDGVATVIAGRDARAAIDVLRQWRAEAMNGADDGEELTNAISPLALRADRADG